VELEGSPDRSATMFCDDGNGSPVYTQEIPFTDFLLDEVKLYHGNNAIHLPFGLPLHFVVESASKNACLARSNSEKSCRR
jgi:hypothetical protein